MTILVKYKTALGVPAGVTCELCQASGGRVNDHCHAHGWVRGTLCASCNSLLGCIENGRRFTTAIDLGRISDFLRRCPDCTPRTIVKPEPLVSVRFHTEAAQELRRLTRQISAVLDRKVSVSDVLEAVAEIGLEHVSEIAKLLPTKGSD